jgi:hypothetical protein
MGVVPGTCAPGGITGFVSEPQRELAISEARQILPLNPDHWVTGRRRTASLRSSSLV